VPQALDLQWGFKPLRYWFEAPGAPFMQPHRMNGVFAQNVLSPKPKPVISTEAAPLPP